MNIKEMIKAGLMVAVVAVCSQIVVPAGDVPFNLAVLAVLIAGGVLKPAYAVLAMVVYLLLGVCGVPVFARMNAGIGALVGPTGGYLVSYPFMALCVSVCKKADNIRPYVGIALAIVICHLFGVLWLAFSRQIPIWSAFLVGSLKFIPFDILKGTLACFVIKKFNFTSLRGDVYEP